MNTTEQNLANELLVQTAVHYNSKNRACDKHAGPIYKTWDERRCAVGRMMTEDGINKVIECGKNADSDVEAIVEMLGIDVFIPHWHPLLQTKKGVNIVKQMQKLHDTDENWNEHGLTQRGMAHAFNISRDIWQEEILEAAEV